MLLVHMRNLRQFSFFRLRACTRTAKIHREMRLPSGTLASTWKRCFSKGSFIGTNQTCAWTEPKGFPTSIRVHNPATKSLVPLLLKNDKIATWYMCGPTVYDSAHIGHACTYVRFDIIRRILTKFFDIDVVIVMGITDIDDKIIKRSTESGQDWINLTKRYEREFFREMASLNVAPPYLSCRVTDYVPQIVSFVEKIMANDAAYLGEDGSVYFDTTRYSGYGKLRKPLPSESHPIKRSSNDFALWKASKPGEPFWKSPWGPGRPGWHIECSAIASTVLGSSIDIHSGGVDLLFPHHENEEAQSCCYHGVDQWVNYWLHSGHLCLTGNEKMSKSLKNTISIPDILANYSANQFRLFCLLTHYRTGIEFSHEKMQGAVGIFKKLENFLADCRNYVSGRLNVAHVDENLVLRTLQSTREKVNACLADDFNTTNAVLAIQELVTIVNKMVKQSEAVKSTSTTGNIVCIAAVAEYISSTLSDFGFSESMNADENQNQLTDVLHSYVNFRQIVRERALKQSVKDKFLLKACDEARQNLSTCGVEIKDHQGTSTWTLTKA